MSSVPSDHEVSPLSTLILEHCRPSSNLNHSGAAVRGARGEGERGVLSGLSVREWEEVRQGRQGLIATA
ncbi:hypothetical protein ElyMa_005427700 [Elysia marginata]|uniref:Uncharacterized protein n=1 Tax=Elysia marginata TaxID=1093978 RepID=A0AAV4EK89_9GAST|nr:hypothetical protein ElyMa_005427700 [Elysia marginata]